MYGGRGRGRGTRGGGFSSGSLKTDYTKKNKKDEKQKEEELLIQISEGVPLFFLTYNPLFSDITVKIDSKEVKTHKFILCQLPYFLDKLEKDTIELTLPIYGFQKVLNLLYGKFEPLSEEKLIEIYIAAMTLQEPFLLNRVINMIPDVSKKNIIPFYSNLKKYFQHKQNDLMDKVKNEFVLNFDLFIKEIEYHNQFKSLSKEDQIELLVHSEIKQVIIEELDDEEEEKKKEKKKVEEKEEETIKLPNYGYNLLSFTDITLFSKDGTSFAAHKAALAIQSKKLYDLVKDVSEIKLDLDSSIVESLLNYVYTDMKLSEQELDILNKNFGVLEQTQEESNKLKDEKLKLKKEIERLKEEISTSKFEWETVGTSGQTTRKLIDKNTLEVIYSSCYNKVYLKPEVTKSCKITITVNGHDDTHGYIGVVNESFDRSTCLCLSPPNAFFLHSNGSAIMNGVTSTSTFHFLPSSNPTVTMKLDAKKKTITFNDKDKYDIIGNSWTFVVGKCNNDTVTYKMK